MRDHDTPPPTGALAAATKVSSSEIPTNNDGTVTENDSNAKVRKVRPEAIREKRTWTKCNIRRKCDECGECFRTKKLLGVSGSFFHFDFRYFYFYLFIGFRFQSIASLSNSWKSLRYL